MVVWALRAIGADPAFFVGGEVPGLGEDGEAANAGWGEGEWVVAEADESDASFLELTPEIAVVTNVEMDHHARWGSLAELHGAFARVRRAGGGRGAAGRRQRSTTLARADGRQASASTPRCPARPSSTSRCPAATTAPTPAPPWPRSSWPGFDVEAAAAALADFPGVRRRLELKGARGGTRIYDDYAHHPTEVRAALSALRELEPEHLIAVFQPHLYSRTKALGEEFGAALALADEVVVLDVYPAREEPVGELAGVSGLRVAQAAAERDGGQAGLVAARGGDGAPRPGRAPRRAPTSARRHGPGHDRRRRRLQARRGAGRRRRRERAARRGRAPTTRWPA